MTIYKRITVQEREEIYKYASQGRGVREIARILLRNPSTISRELRRLGNKDSYSPSEAEKDSQKKASSRRYGQRKIFGELEEIIEKFLLDRWSPEQISDHLEFTKSNLHISHEAIYQHIYRQNAEKRKKLIQCLRRRKKIRRRRKAGTEKRGVIPNMKRIHDRSEAANNRTEVGHWEGDLIVGKDHKSALIKIVERVFRFVLIVLLKTDMTSITVVMGCEKALKSFPDFLRKSFTYDRGKEMTLHELLSSLLGIEVYFADPHSPWQRGTNENTNGLIRDFFPKGTDFSKCTEEEVLNVQILLNNRPRKTLNYQTPNEVLNAYLNCQTQSE